MRCDLPANIIDAAGWMPRRQTPVAAGRQIRDYVLDQNRVKDLRTGLERAPSQVLDGDLDDFVAAALKLGSARRRRHNVTLRSSRP